VAVYQITTSFAVGGILVSDKTGVVIEAAPIFRRYEGRLLENVVADVERRGGKIEKVEKPTPPL
jgi:hypothetical protein